MTSTGSTLNLIPHTLTINSRNRKIYTDVTDRNDIRNKPFNMTVDLPDELKYYKRISLIGTEIPLSGYNIRHETLNTNNIITFIVKYYKIDSVEQDRSITCYLSLKTHVFNHYDNFIEYINENISVIVEDTSLIITLTNERNNIFNNNNAYYLNQITIKAEFSSLDYKIISFYWFNKGETNMTNSYDNMYVNKLIGVNDTLSEIHAYPGVSSISLIGDIFMTDNDNPIIIQSGTNNKLQILLNNPSVEGTANIHFLEIPPGAYDEITFEKLFNNEMITQIFNGGTITDYITITYNTKTLKYDFQGKQSDLTNEINISFNKMIFTFVDTEIGISATNIYSLPYITFLRQLGLDTITPPIPDIFNIPNDETIVPGDSVAQLSTDDYLFIGVNVVRGQATELTADYPNLWNKGIIAKIQLSQILSGVQLFDNQKENVFDVYNNLSGNGINAIIRDELIVTIYRKDGTMYDLNGANWSFSINLYI